MYEDLNVHTVRTPYGNPDKWAQSTLPKPHNFDELVEIYTIEPGKFTDGNKSRYPRERIWLHDLLDDKEILYKVDVLGTFNLKLGGVRRTRGIKEAQHIFVRKEDEKAARRLMRKYERAAAVSEKVEFSMEEALEQVRLDTGFAEEFGEEQINTFDIDNLPQIQCPHCGVACDTDYEKCPKCKGKLYL